LEARRSKFLKFLIKELVIIENQLWFKISKDLLSA
jgi:hypothetical protein